MREEHFRNDLQDTYRDIKACYSFRTLSDEKVLKLTPKQVKLNDKTYVCDRPSSLTHCAKSSGSQGKTSTFGCEVTYALIN